MAGWGGGGDAVGGFGGDFAGFEDVPLSFDAHRLLAERQAAVLVPFFAGEIDSAASAGFDAAVALVDFGVFRGDAFGGVPVDGAEVFAEFRLVSLDGSQDVVGVVVLDQAAGGFALHVQCVEGDGAAFEGQPFGELVDGGNLIALVLHPFLSEHRAGGVLDRRHQDAAAVLDFPTCAAHVLAVDRHRCACGSLNCAVHWRRACSSVSSDRCDRTLWKGVRVGAVNRSRRRL